MPAFHGTVAAYALALALFLSLASRPAPAGRAPLGVIVPLYGDPGSGWDTVLQTKHSYPAVQVMAVINPANGSGSTRDPRYAASIEKLKSAEIVVLGYVDTFYGVRPKGSVIADMNSYKDWYKVDGIFFDEMANVRGYESYYSSQSDYAMSIGMRVTVGNPGTVIPSSYIRTVDILNVYEKVGLPDAAAICGSCSGSLEADLAVIGYGVPSVSPSYLNSISDYVRYVYFTDQLPPNPYYILSTYYPSLVSMLNRTSAQTLPQPSS